MKGYTYILTNKNKNVLYIGATNDIKRRINEHKNRLYDNAFTKKYNCNLLVYFEEYDDVASAFKREKQLKAGNRKKKEALINSMNPAWNDLAVNWIDQNFGLKSRHNL